MYWPAIKQVTLNPCIKYFLCKMSCLFTFFKKGERLLNFFSLWKSCFLKYALLLNFLFWWSKNWKKIKIKTIVWGCLNRYYSMLLSWRYYKLSYFLLQLFHNWFQRNQNFQRKSLKLQILTEFIISFLTIFFKSISFLTCFIDFL